MLLCISQVPLKVENFLYPLETDGALLEMYMTAIATATVRWEGFGEGGERRCWVRHRAENCLH